MWIIELAFTDAPERLNARAAHRQHLAALHDSGVVRMAGPFADDSGGLIVLDVAGRDQVEEVMSADPYFTTEGVVVRRVERWQPFLA
ncbi:YciI family protein [Micromonospora sp. NPDC049301]|uniref:YciI family protein n=1 Tax=Micromonospora sp. NPDC049301 TaxID=3155723 RepID=UPI003438B05D